MISWLLQRENSRRANDNTKHVIKYNMEKYYPDLNLLAIEVTKLCNLRCKMCISHNPSLYQGQADNQPNFIDINLFKHIVDQYSNLKQEGGKNISPQFQGEPLLHPNFIELCKYINKKCIHLNFSTNGTLLTPEIGNELLKLPYFNSICFSLDGVKKETFENIRVNADYDVVYSNLSHFLENANRRRNKGDLTVALNFTEMEENSGEFNEFITKWIDKVDSISSGTVAINGRPTQLRWIPDRIPCHDLWHRMIILTDGHVVPCCRDYLYQFDMGNLNQHPLNEIWVGEKYERMRTNHLQKKWGVYPVCADCDTWMVNTKDRKIEKLTPRIQLTIGPFFLTAESKDIKSDLKKVSRLPMVAFNKIYRTLRF